MDDDVIKNEEILEKEGSENEKKHMSIVRTPLFHKSYATNVSVTKTDSDFRIELFNEKFESEDGWVYHSDGLVILTTQAAKILLTTLSEKIDEYEGENGEIVIYEDRKNIT